MPNSTPDLTKQAPRSARVRLGGYAILPRMLDKGRAELAGKNGEYHYACPMDMRLLDFLGLDPAPLKEQLATGKGDGKILAWILASRKNQHTDIEIAGGPLTRIIVCRPTRRRASILTNFILPPHRSAKTSRRGLTCSMWMIT